jgi:hypothetical protein
MEEKLSEAIQNKYQGNLFFQIVPRQGKISCEGNSGSFQICCQICCAEVEVSVYRRPTKSGTPLYSPKFQRLDNHLEKSPRCSNVYHLHQAIISYRDDYHMSSIFVDEIPAIKCCTTCVM